MSRMLRGLVSLVIAGGLVMFGSAHALAASGGAPMGAGPDTALAPNGGWVPLAVGQRVWYAFQYAGDNSPILVDVAASPSNGATFSVWTPANLASWAAGLGENPVGHGSGDGYVNGGDQVWQGQFNEPGTYYVVVDQARSTASGILVNVIGSGVSTEAATPRPAPVPTLQPISFTPNRTHTPSVAVAGAGPDTALAPNGGWVPLAVGQRVWYAFQYAGDNSPILVDVAASPSNGATFSVWTPANLASWAASLGENPVGHGSGDGYVNGGDQVWQGQFNEPGTYYVVVDQARSTASGILVNVSGGGVSTGAPRLGAQAGGR